MRSASSMEELKELVDEVLYEVREARADFESDDEFMEDPQSYFVS